MDNSIRFRSASNQDGEAVRSLVSTVLQEFGFTPDHSATDSDLFDLETTYIHSGGSFDLLIDQAGEIVGTVGLFPLPDKRCQLRKMYLASAHRGRGLGKRLLQQALNRARQLGFQRIELETANSLEAAIHLYKSFGFKEFIPDHMSSRCNRAYYLELGEKISSD